MSGSLGLLAADVASMLVRQAPLSVGDVFLEGHEVPHGIALGGAQAVTVHKFPGGGRVVDAMGADEGSIAWNGLFVGADAAPRARRLDIMRQQGEPQTLAFGEYNFQIIIIQFQYSYENQGAVIPYRIRAEVLPLSEDTQPTDAQDSLPVSLGSDLSIAQTVLQNGQGEAEPLAGLVSGGAGAGVLASTAAVGSLVTFLGSTSTLVGTSIGGNVSSTSAIQLALETAAVSLQAAINSVSADALGSQTEALIFASSSTLAQSAAQAGILAALVRSAGYLNRVHANIVSADAQTVMPLLHA